MSLKHKDIIAVIIFLFVLIVSTFISYEYSWFKRDISKIIFPVSMNIFIFFTWAQVRVLLNSWTINKQGLEELNKTLPKGYKG